MNGVNHLTKVVQHNQIIKGVKSAIIIAGVFRGKADNNCLELLAIRTKY